MTFVTLVSCTKVDGIGSAILILQPQSAGYPFSESDIVDAVTERSLGNHDEHTIPDSRSIDD